MFLNDLRQRNAGLKQRAKDEEKQKALAGARNSFAAACKAAAERDESVAALRADLAKPWTSVIIAERYDRTCTGTTYFGCIINRANGAMTVAPWEDDRVGESRALSLPEVERLLSETALFYLAASLSVSPEEKAGPRPSDPIERAKWYQRYLEAGGQPESGDQYWFEVRVTTPEGEKRHSNMWDRPVPSDFFQWIKAFGTVPRR